MLCSDHTRFAVFIATAFLLLGAGAEPPPSLGATSAQKAWVGEHLSQASQQQLTSIGRSIGQKQTLADSDLDRWETLVRRAASETGSSTDVDALVRWTMSEAYEAANQDLLNTADQLKANNEAKREIRNDVGGLRSSSPDVVEATPEGERKTMSARTAAHNLEEGLATAGDDSQLANTAIQNSTQSQTQMTQMLSAVMKTLHDSAMAIIRNIGS